MYLLSLCNLDFSKLFLSDLLFLSIRKSLLSFLGNFSDSVTKFFFFCGFTSVFYMCFKIFLKLDFPGYKLYSQKQLSFISATEVFKLGSHFCFSSLSFFVLNLNLMLFFLSSSCRWLVVFVLVTIPSHQSSTLVIGSIADGFRASKIHQRCGCREAVFNSLASVSFPYWVTRSPPVSWASLPYSYSLTGGGGGGSCGQVGRATWILLMCTFTFWSFVGQAIFTKSWGCWARKAKVLSEFFCFLVLKASWSWSPN